MRGLITLLLTLGLAAPALGQVRPTRFVSLANETWGYVQSGQGTVAFPDSVWEGPGAGFRAGLQITILTRNGQPVTQADRVDATYAARAVCEETRRDFDMRVPAILLRRGGFTFPGACG